MKIVRLNPGEMAAEDTDCIKINATPSGKFTLVASALMMCGDGDNAESVALVSNDPYSSYDEAEAAGLAWAQEHCVETIYVETGGKPEPVLPDR